MKALLLAVIFQAIACGAHAADSLRILAAHPMSAHYFTTDELGNIYAVLQDNTFVRYDALCDSTGFYRSTLNGQLGSADVSNPLRILLYFPSFSKIQILDRQLSLKAEIDLRALQLFSAHAVATASDGKIWVYDPVQARIVKLDETGSRALESNDLRELLPFVPAASTLQERDQRLYLNDTSQGVLVFDAFATYITTLPFRHIKSLSVIGKQLVFLQGDTLHRYDMQSFSESYLPVPKRHAAMLDARITRKGLTVLYEDAIIVYALPEKFAE